MGLDSTTEKWESGFARDLDGRLLTVGAGGTSSGTGQIGETSNGNLTVVGGLDDTDTMRAVSVDSAGVMAVTDASPAYATGSKGGASVLNGSSTTTNLPAVSTTRRQVTVTNDGPADVWVALDGSGTAVAGQGHYLSAFGGSVTEFYRGVVAAISNGASAHVCWQTY